MVSVVIHVVSAGGRGEMIMQLARKALQSRVTPTLIVANMSEEASRKAMLGIIVW
jgi:hypothetical protein